MASLSGVFNFQQFAVGAGNTATVLAGGRVYTYEAGTTTHKVAYTDAAELVPQTYVSDGAGGLYIALNARGEMPAPLFLSLGVYDITLKTSAGVQVWTRQAIPLDYSDAEGTRVETVTATDGQTLITVPFIYTRGNDSLRVFVNGIQFIGYGNDYTETTTTSITVTRPLKAGAEVTFISGSGVNPSSVTGTVSDTALAASTGSALVGHIASGTDAVARTVQDSLRDIVSVFSFFTDAQKADVRANTKSISVATAFAACLTAVQAAGGGAVWMPPGGYLAPTISTADGASVRIMGSGNQNTTIWTNSATASVLDLIAWNSSIEHVGFDSTVTRTAGNYVTLTGAFTSAVNCQFQRDYTGVFMVGVNAKVLHCVFREGAANGVRIVVGGGDTSPLIHGTLMAAQLAPFPLAGIRVQNNSSLTISDTSVIAQGVCLLIDPGNGQTVYSLKAHDCFFDNAGTGVLIQPDSAGATGGSVQRVDFIDCWTCSMTGSGFQIIQAGTASVTGVRLVNHQGHLNAGSGVDISAASTTLLADFNVLGGAFAKNTNYGIAIGNNVCGFSIMGARCGAADGLTGNTQRGIIVFGTNHDNYSITGNFLLGNTGGAMLDQGTGTTKIVRHNLGYNPIAPAAVSVGASPYTYTNTSGDTAVLAIYGGTVSSVTLNGRTVATATNTAVTVPHGRSVVITHSSTPSAEVMGF